MRRDGAFVDVGLTKCARETCRVTLTHVLKRQVNARGILSARIRRTVVDIDFAEVARKTAATTVAIDCIQTISARLIVARVRRAFVDVSLAEIARVARHVTLARIVIYAVNAR